ncbi:MAG: 4Fe-4S dicluster domain-containing protein [Thermoplasmata archaeon]|nr:MAG: 4Fe-4S dicluster domain-containing protein [Thermoplasmata archaeon]
MTVTPVRIDMGAPDLLARMASLGSGNVLKCYQCGTCVGDCPAILSDLHVRRLMKYSIYGLEDRILGDQGVWGCTTCHACSERCPEGASPFELVMAVRRYQSQLGKLPEALRAISGNVLEMGHAVDLQEKHKKARVSVGLPEVPPTILQHPEMLEEVRSIVAARELMGLLEKGGD